MMPTDPPPAAPDLSSITALPWVGAVSGILIAVLVGLAYLLDKARGTVDSGGNLITTWMQQRRLVQAASDSSLEGRLKRCEEELARVITQLDAIRSENSDLRAYSWASYGEIRRLDPTTRFPRPPRPTSIPTRPYIQSPDAMPTDLDSAT